MQISGLQRIAPVTPPEQTSATQNVQGAKSEFSNVLSDVVRGVNQDMLQADQAVQDFESGKSPDLNSVVMATVKSDLSFRFLIEMRNRVTETYQELSRMQF